MKKLLLLCALIVALLPRNADAQSSACAGTPLSGTTNIVSSTFPFAIKVPAGITATAFKITVDSAKVDLTTTVGTPTPTGDQCFNASVTVSGNGVHTIKTHYTPSGGTEATSDPFVLNLVDPKPVNYPR